ncbi:hypothetical protein [Streptomyces sp. NPDC002845]
MHRHIRTKRTLAVTAATTAAIGMTALTGCEVTVSVGNSSSSPSAPAPGASDASSRVLGPDGIGPLKIGMPLDEAEATGEFEHGEEDPEACMSHTSDNGIVMLWSSKRGIYSLTAENARTPEDIGPGSTFADVKQAYPTPAEADDMSYDDQLSFMGTVWTSVPDRPKAMYAIAFDRSTVTRDAATLDTARVLAVHLKLKAEQNC